MDKIKILILSIFLAGFLHAEQSVYSDSDFVDVDTIAKKNSRTIFMLKQQISQLKEKIEGLKSIINGQADEIAQLKQKVDNTALVESINQLTQRVAKLEQRPAQVIKVKEEASVAKVSTDKSEESTKSKETSEKEPKAEESKSVSNKELYKKSVLDFTNNRLTKAKKGFKKLLAKGYKKASSSFYLGEIAYKKGRYKEAIEYYQKSATLNDGASYMDKLLYHTAISLHKKGKDKEAKVFLNAVIDGYPNSSIVKEAKAYLDNLKHP